MKKQLEYLAVKLCEQLPFGITILKKDGSCQVVSDKCNECKYSKKKSKDDYLCSKKTYTPLFQLNTI